VGAVEIIIDDDNDDDRKNVFFAPKNIYTL